MIASALLREKQSSQNDNSKYNPLSISGPPGGGGDALRPAAGGAAAEGWSGAQSIHESGGISARKSASSTTVGSAEAGSFVARSSARTVTCGQAASTPR